MRLQKVLAAAGVASRRAAEGLIAAGRVAVNGEVVRGQGRRVDPRRDRIEVDGRRVAADPTYDYWILNKPDGIVTTARDPRGRPTVVDLVPSEHRLYPVGRLDMETTGLVLLTNHGELAHRMAHPRYGIERVYVARVAGVPGDADLAVLTRGIRLEDGPARALAVRVVRRAARHSQVEITMGEGRKREVRRLLDAIGYPVEQLARVGFGPLRLGRLAQGETRRLRAEEVGALLRAVGL